MYIGVVAVFISGCEDLEIKGHTTLPANRKCPWVYLAALWAGLLFVWTGV
jgi:hypothetical protein